MAFEITLFFAIQNLPIVPIQHLMKTSAVEQLRLLSSSIRQSDFFSGKFTISVHAGYVRAHADEKQRTGSFRTVFIYQVRPLVDLDRFIAATVGKKHHNAIN